jgi:tetratricopeptide (TPR) repeat protein
MKRYLVLLAAVGCYQPSAVRQEKSELGPRARETLVAALHPADNKAEFEKHYAKALSFYERGAFPEAIAEFEAAHELKPEPLLLFNIGQAYRKAGKKAPAIAAFRKFLVESPTNEQRDRASRYIEEMEHAPR